MHKLKNLLLLLTAVTLFSTIAVAQKKKNGAKTSQTVPASGVIKTVKGQGKDIIKFVKLDSATKSTVVTGVTLDWEKDGQVYFDITLKKGQHLTITPDSNDTIIELYMNFSPLDATTSGAYEHAVTKTADYQIVARTGKIGEKYTLTLKVK